MHVLHVDARPGLLYVAQDRVQDHHECDHDRVHRPWVCGKNLDTMDAATVQVQVAGLTVGLVTAKCRPISRASLAKPIHVDQLIRISEVW